MLRSLRPQVASPILALVPYGIVDATSWATILAPADWDLRGTLVVVDAVTFEVVHTNRRGAAMLERGYPAWLLGGRLGLTPSDARHRIRSTLAAMQPLSSAALVVVRDDQNRDAYSIRIMRLDAQQGDRDVQIAVLDFGVLSVSTSPTDLRAIGDAFELTPAERAVLGHLSSGFSLVEIAGKRGVQIETVREQCKRLLVKTRCQRQVDLVRLVHGLCAPGQPSPG